jgi:hypothetical protein
MRQYGDPNPTYDRRKNEGKCIKCEKEAKKGKHHCPEHLEKEQKGAEDRREQQYEAFVAAHIHGDQIDLVAIWDKHPIVWKKKWLDMKRLGVQKKSPRRIAG